MNEELSISTDKSLLDVDYIHNFLAGSYWAKGIPKHIVVQSIEHSLCFGIYLQGAQVGFARVVTDYTTFAYLADVFIDEKERGNGFGKLLVGAIVNHERLKGLRRWHLLTEDAQGLYAQFGFIAPKKPENHMEIRRELNYQDM